MPLSSRRTTDVVVSIVLGGCAKQRPPLVSRKNRNCDAPSLLGTRTGEELCMPKAAGRLRESCMSKRVDDITLHQILINVIVSGNRILSASRIQRCAHFPIESSCRISSPSFCGDEAAPNQASTDRVGAASERPCATWYCKDYK